MESNNFLFKKPLLMVAIMAKWFEESLVWFSDLAGVKFEPTKSATQAIIRELLRKPNEMEAANFFVVRKVDNRTTVDT